MGLGRPTPLTDKTLFFFKFNSSFIQTILVLALNGKTNMVDVALKGMVLDGALCATTFVVSTSLRICVVRQPVRACTDMDVVAHTLVELVFIDCGDTAAMRTRRFFARMKSWDIAHINVNLLNVVLRHPSALTGYDFVVGIQDANRIFAIFGKVIQAVVKNTTQVVGG